MRNFQVMRGFVVGLALAALSSVPVLAQAALPAVTTKVDALSLRNACLMLASNPDGIAEAITAAGWKIDPMPGATLFSRTSYGELRFEVAGRGTILWTVENYPGFKFGFCRMDFPGIDGALGLPGLAADANYKANVESAADVTDGAWSRDVDGVRTLISGHEDPNTFSVQVTVIQEAADEPAQK